MKGREDPTARRSGWRGRRQVGLCLRSDRRWLGSEGIISEFYESGSSRGSWRPAGS